MKETLSPMRMEKPSLFTAQKTSGDSQNAFPSGDESFVQFSNGDEISAYSFTRDKFSADFSSEEGVPPGL